MRAMPILLSLALLPTSLSADEAAGSRLRVTGSGSVEAEPDRAVVRLGVESEAPQARAAQAEANRVANAILDATRSLDVAEEAVQTSRLQLFPVYASRRPSGEGPDEPRVVGYRASNTVSITLEDLDRIGPVVDASIEAGANRVESLEFTLADDSEARAAALAAAVRDARSKAEVVARALDMDIGRLIEVTEGGAEPSPVGYREHAALAMDSAGAPVSPGRLTISARVTLSAELLPRS